MSSSFDFAIDHLILFEQFVDILNNVSKKGCLRKAELKIALLLQD